MKALVIVDMQNDFMPGGPLGVPKAEELVPKINKLIPQFALVLATKDWHPKDHSSFAVNHKEKGKKVVDGQILWPIHCVQDTQGAEFVKELEQTKISQIFYKGIRSKVDSYSAFFDNAHQVSTGLFDYLKEQQIKEITIVGVATDYCILYSVLDALALGLKVTVITDCCAGINVEKEDEHRAFLLMKERGAILTTLEEVL